MNQTKQNPIPPEHKVLRGQRLPIESLVIDDASNRPIHPEYLAKLTREFNEALYEEITVCANFPESELVLDDNGNIVVQENQTFTVTEGQHRRTAGGANGLSFMYCKVHFIEKVGDRMLLHFLLQGSKKNESAYQKYRARVISGHYPEFTKVDKALKAMNLDVVERSPGKNSIASAAEVAKDTQRYGADVVVKAIKVLEAAFDRSAKTWNAYLIGGVSRMLAENPSVFSGMSESEIGAKLRGTNRSPRTPDWYVREMSGILGRAGTSGGSGSRVSIMTDLLSEEWNKRNRSKTKHIVTRRQLAELAAQQYETIDDADVDFGDD